MVRTKAEARRLASPPPSAVNPTEEVGEDPPPTEVPPPPPASLPEAASPPVNPTSGDPPTELPPPPPASSSRDTEASQSKESRSSREESAEESAEESREESAEDSEKETEEDEEEAAEVSREESEKETEEGSESSKENEGWVDPNAIPIGVMPPVGFFIKKNQYPRTTKIATRCYIAKAVKEIEKRLDTHEMEWFRNHPQFNHFFHMPRDATHKSMGMWMLILRMARIEKRNELWFVVNGVPIRYLMREHALISGLFCHEYPRNYEELGNLEFVGRHFKNVERVTQEMVETKFLSMNGRTKDKLKMAVLYFLTQVMKGNAKRGIDAPAVDTFLMRIVTNLDWCRDFPWGRFTFFDNLNEVGRMVALFRDGEVNKGCNFSSFMVPLELLAFEAIPKLGNFFREPVRGANNRCPRMCKGKFKSWGLRGFPIEHIYRELGDTHVMDSILQPTMDERHLIAEIEVEDDVDDPVVDGWNHRLLVENQPIYFEELKREDIENRTVEVVEVEDDEEEAVGETEAEESGEGIGLKDLKELQEIMVAGFKEMKEKLESVDDRLSMVETLVTRMSFPGDDKQGNDGDDDEMGDDDASRAGKEVEEAEGDETLGSFLKKVKKRRRTYSDGGNDGGNDDNEDGVEVEKGKEGGNDEMGKEVEEAKDGRKKGKNKKRSHSYVLKEPYSKPNTRQRARE